MARLRLVATFLLLAVALALPALLRERPLVPWPFTPLLVDGLSGLFVALALLGAAALLALGVRLLPLIAATGLVALGACADLWPLTALCFGLAAIVGRDAGEGSNARFNVFALLAALGPGAVLLLAAVLLRQGGSWRLSSVDAGAGLQSATFALVLAATLLGVIAQTPQRSMNAYQGLLLAPAWAYPLVRLYSLGPWNTSWHLAALLLCGGLAIWSAAGAVGEPDQQACRALLLRALLATALLSLALGSSAGVAAGGYGLLSYLLPATALFLRPPPQSSWLKWSLAGVMPLTAPFVATWLAIGAAVASAAPLVAMGSWLSMLLVGITLALRPHLWAGPGRLLAATSIVAGVCSPLLIEFLVMPAVARLQGGLSPLGDLVIWPWVGLGMRNSGGQEVATLPSLLVAALLVVLLAIVYLLGRLLGGGDGRQEPAQHEQPDESLWEAIRREVFWLGGRPGTDA